MTTTRLANDRWRPGKNCPAKSPRRALKLPESLIPGSDTREDSILPCRKEAFYTALVRPEQANKNERSPMEGEEATLHGIKVRTDATETKGRGNERKKIISQIRIMHSVDSRDIFKRLPRRYASFNKIHSSSSCNVFFIKSINDTGLLNDKCANLDRYNAPVSGSQKVEVNVK